MGNNTFKRVEVKYLLNQEQKAAVYQAMQSHMEEDKFGNSTIRNIYFDKPDFQLIRASLEKPIYKEKLRVRSYKRVDENDKVFVELKKKYDGVVYKRRISMTEKEASDYLGGNSESKRNDQISKEIDYFLDFYGDIKAKVFISYDRSAYFDKENPNLRMTFDENILWRTDDLSLCKEVYGKPILKDGEALLEIKSAGSIPIWLAETLSKNNIYKVSFSKYGKAYNQILEERMKGCENNEYIH